MIVTTYYTIKERLDDYINYYDIFIDCEDIDFDLRRIHPTRQQAVYDLYKFATDNETITELWVFGSSANASCMPDSDVDIAYKSTCSYTTINNRILNIMSKHDLYFDLVDMNTGISIDLKLSIWKGVRLK